jgi:uncharacterized hydrophobic protein (TIGR00271 family)
MQQQLTLGQKVIAAFDVSRGRAKYSTIRERIVSGARIDGIHLCQLGAAILIASIGLNTDSTTAIIGAMLICPLMGSVLAISCSVATIDMRMLNRVMSSLLLQTCIGLLTSTIYFRISPLSTQTSELLTNSSATIWDLLIALIGGFAGALGLSRRQEPSTLVSGVAVATALMPPLCSVGYGLAHGDALFALSALYEYLINVLFIAFGSTVVLLWLRMPIVGDLDGDGKEDEEEKERAVREGSAFRHRLVVTLLIFALPCGYFSVRVVKKSIAETGTVFEVMDTYDTEQVTQELEIVCPDLTSYHVGVEDSYDLKSDALQQRVVATVETKEELDDANKQQVEALIRLHVDDLDEVSFLVEGEKG